MAPMPPAESAQAGWIPPPGLLLDPDGLDVDEPPHAIAGELATVPAPLDAAEWDLPVRGRHTVDEDAAGLDLAGQLLGALDVLRPDRAAEPIRRVVRLLDRRILIRHTGDCRYRPEAFLTEERHIRRDVVDDGRRIVITLALRPLAAGDQVGSGVHRLAQLPLDRVAQVGAGHRSHRAHPVSRIAELDRFGFLLEQFDELVGHLVDDDEALG